MSIRYHYNPETGRASVCKAESRSCPLDSGENHQEFSSKDDANEWARARREGKLSETYSPLRGTTKGFNEEQFVSGLRTTMRKIGLPRTIDMFDFSEMNDPQIQKTFTEYKLAAKNYAENSTESGLETKNWRLKNLCIALENHLNDQNNFDIMSDYADWLIHDYTL